MVKTRARNRTCSYEVTVTPGTRFMMNSAATVAFGFPTSLGLVSSVRYMAHVMNRRAIPEEKLAIKVTEIDGVHVDNVNVLEAS